MAIETGAPSSASTTAVLTANANIKTAFGASPVFFAIDAAWRQIRQERGERARRRVTDTVNLTVDLTKLASEQDLVVGFYGAAGPPARAFPASPSPSPPMEAARRC